MKDKRTIKDRRETGERRKGPSSEYDGMDRRMETRRIRVISGQSSLSIQSSKPVGSSTLQR